MTVQFQQMENLIRNTISNGMQEFGNQISSQFREMANSLTLPAGPRGPPGPVATGPAMRGGRNRPRLSGFPVRRPNDVLRRAVRYLSYLNSVFNLNLRPRAQKLIREFFEQVAPTILQTAVGRDEATQFENEWKEDHTCVSCTEEDFRLYFGGTPSHAWNSTALRMLSQCFAYFHQLDDAELISIENGMISRFKSLKKAYNRLQLSIANQNRGKQVARRKTRKSQAWIAFPLKIMRLTSDFRYI